MASNSSSSSVVISFSIAILLLLILLLLLSYNSKNKRDNTEQFYNVSPTDLINPFKNGSFNDIFNSINKKDKENFYNTPDHSMASFDPYASNSTITNPNMGVEANNLEDKFNYASLSGNISNGNNKYSSLKEGFENEVIDDGNATTCIKKDKLTSQDLLPKDAQNSKWSDLNPSNVADISAQNFLTAGYHIGVNTVGQSLRNANLQLRSEIPNPQVAVSPWLISTIEPDVRSTTLEIGSNPTY